MFVMTVKFNKKTAVVILIALAVLLAGTRFVFRAKRCRRLKFFRSEDRWKSGDQRSQNRISERFGI